MKHLTALLIIPLLGALVTVQAAEKPRGKPNILHIHADDHRPDGLHALGNSLLRTPNLDTLVARGMTFTRAYTMGSMTGAVCEPSRRMMLTGRSWQRIPGEPAAAPNAADAATFLPRIIASAGYRTWHMGKYGNGFVAGLKEFDISIKDGAHGQVGEDDNGLLPIGKADKDVNAKLGVGTPENDRAHSSQRLADRTIDFLMSRAASHETKPFYVYLAPAVPHDPWYAEPRFHQIYDPEKIPLSPAFLPQHPFDNGEMTVRDERLAPWPRTPENTRKQIADHYACITGFDHHVGRIFAALKAAGEWENTIIVFSGDNGMSLGDHGLFGKQNLYEFGGMHTPLVIAGPGISQGRSEALVYLMDLFPTFAEFAGAKIPDGVEGKSLLPILNGAKQTVREVLYTGYRDSQRAIRNDRWKLIRYPLVDQTQLFDLSVDPHELNNLADQLGYAPKIVELMQLLKQQMSYWSDPFPLSVAHPNPAAWTPPARDDL